MSAPGSDRELLTDCAVETFRSSGPGGQHANRRETAVRIRHIPTGIVVTCQQERSQRRNKRIALARLREKLEERNRPVVERVPTTVPRGVRRRVLEAKRRRARKKASRQRPELDD